MKAAIFLGAKRIEIQEIPKPKPAENQILLKIIGCGVCGTDAHIFSGQLKVAKPPVVLGHEFTGEIEAVGAGVKNFQPGQIVSVDPVLACGTCEFCHSGRPNLCPQPTVIGYVVNGGFAEYTVIPQTHVYPISPKIGLKGGILVETLACVLHGFDRLELIAGKNVLILGAGTVGCLWTQLIRHTPTNKIIQTEIIPFRQKMARELGADDVINPEKENLSQAIQEICPEGPDYIIDATGNARAVEQALPLIRKGGTFMIFGVCAESASIQVSPYLIYQKEMKIIASKMPPQTLDRSVKLLESGHINYEKIVNCIMPLKEIGKAFEMFEQAKDKVIKIAIDPHAI